MLSNSSWDLCSSVRTMWTATERLACRRIAYLLINSTLSCTLYIGPRRKKPSWLFYTEHNALAQNEGIIPREQPKSSLLFYVQHVPVWFDFTQTYKRKHILSDGASQILVRVIKNRRMEMVIMKERKMKGREADKDRESVLTSHVVLWYIMMQSQWCSYCFTILMPWHLIYSILS